MGAIGSIFRADKINIALGANNDLQEKSVAVNRTEFLLIVDSAIIYPREKSVLEKEIKEASIVINYKCVDQKCSFESVLKEMIEGQKAAELKGLGVQGLTKEIVTVIQANPSVFPSSGLNGYLFQSVGKPYLYLKNDTSLGKCARTGFMDLSDVRKRTFFEAMREKETDDKLVEVGTGILIGGFMLQGAQHFLKMARK
jgi:hypothetical protein